jgi:DNA-binding LacI/PurR family transcriptional regulator
VRQPLEEVAIAVVRSLEDLLATPSHVADGLLLSPTLVVRGTS